MKVALLTKYGSLAASTRQRFEQYSPYLQAQGFELDPRPLLDDEYLKHLYASGKRNPKHVASRYFKRLKWLMTVRDVDLLWLHCELFPYFPGLIEGLSRLPGKPIVFDYDDAIFHNYDQHKNALIKAVLAPKLRKTLGVAELALCGNEYLADYARPQCKRVEIVPTVVDVESYLPSSKLESAKFPRIGWIGTPSTWNDYMVPRLEVLTKAAEAGGARLAAMGAGSLAHPHPLLDLTPWSEAGEVSFIQSADIGVMPLDDSPWANGKCGYKLIQYMACGLPVIASPVGVNSQIVEHGVNGFLAETDAEWATALDALLSSSDLRERMGVAGRKKVEQEYSLQVYGPKVAKMLMDVAQSG